jgi:hypothetical protein
MTDTISRLPAEQPSPLLVRVFEFAYEQHQAVLAWAARRQLNRAAVTIALLLTAVAITGGAMWLVITVLDTVLDVVLRAMVWQIQRWNDVPVVGVFLDAVGSYFAAHNASLPLSSSGLARLWFSAGGVFLLCAIAGSLTARLAWTAHGAVTVAMAWFGADAGNRPITAGAAALAWGLLSLLAFNRRPRKHARPAADAPAAA